LRLTPRGKFVAAVLAALVVFGLAAAVRGVVVKIGGWAQDSAVAWPGQAEDGDGAALDATPGSQAGDHPDAAVVVTYSVAGAGPIEVVLADFAREAQAILDDPSGWRSAGVGFDRVAEGGDFILWLATPDQMTGFAEGCAPEYSCRVGPDVIINQERWLTGALPGALDGIDLGEYRTMVVNHEVGHWLGHEHVGCPAPGQPAPLMMQQSKGLDGCLANPYPLPEERTAPALGLV
jgi:hypothetical protein